MRQQEVSTDQGEGSGQQGASPWICGEKAFPVRDEWGAQSPRYKIRNGKVAVGKNGERCGTPVRERPW